MVQTYYNSATGQTYSPDQMLGLFGVDVETTAIDVLNYQSFYPVQASSPTFDLNLYDATSTWSIIPITPSGEGATRVYTAVAKPLEVAKANASAEVKATSNAEAESLVTASGVNLDIWAGAASQDPLDRPPVYNTLLDAMATIGDNLATLLAAIDAASSVNEINDLLHLPTGILNTGRGSGLGPEDLNPSYYVEFNSPSLTAADTELYVPDTDTVIPYDAESLPPPYQFDSFGDCFNSGNYIMQIRVAATGAVIAEFEVPYNPSSEDISF